MCPQHDRAMPVPDIYQVRCLETDELSAPAGTCGRQPHRQHERVGYEGQRLFVKWLNSEHCRDEQDDLHG